MANEEDLSLPEIVSQAASAAERVTDLYNSKAENVKAVGQAVQVAKEFKEDHIRPGAYEEASSAAAALIQAMLDVRDNDSAFHAACAAQFAACTTKNAIMSKRLERHEARLRGAPYDPSQSFKTLALRFLQLTKEHAKIAER